MPTETAPVKAATAFPSATFQGLPEFGAQKQSQSEMTVVQTGMWEQ